MTPTTISARSAVTRSQPAHQPATQPGMRTPQRPTPRTVLAALLAGAALLTACGNDTETAAPAETTTTSEAPTTTTEATTTTTTAPELEPLPEDPLIIMHTTPDVTGDEVATVVHGVNAARTYLDDRDRPIDVYLAKDPVDAFEDPYIVAFGKPASEKGRLVNEMSRNNTGLSTRDGRGVVFLAGKQILQPYNWVSAFVTAAHETVHTYQDYATAWRDPGPAWLTEGQATLLAFRLAYERDEPPAGMTWEDIRNDIMLPRAQAEQRPLDTLVNTSDYTEGASENTYAKGTFAAEWLEHHAGPDALHRNYWTAIASMGWQDAFTQSFGMTLPDFFAGFAEWEAAGYPELGT